MQGTDKLKQAQHTTEFIRGPVTFCRELFLDCYLVERLFLQDG